MIKAQSVIRLLLAGLAAVACSTTKVLREGEYRLAGNKVEITNDRRFNANELNPYILQKPNSSVIFGWSPFLYVYNWGKADPEKGGLFRKIGEAPVVFDSTQVKSSVDNMLNHLEYTGWYGSSISRRPRLRRRASVPRSISATSAITDSTKTIILSRPTPFPPRGRPRSRCPCGNSPETKAAKALRRYADTVSET